MRRYLLALAILLLTGNTCLAQTHTTYDNTQYDLRVQRTEIESQVITSDKKFVVIKASALFYINKKDVPYIHKTLGPKYATGMVPDTLYGETHALFGSHTEQEIFSAQREKLLLQLQTNIQNKLTPYRINIRNVNLTSIGYIPQIMNAIAQKMIAEQDVYRAENESKAAEIRQEIQKKAEIAQAERNVIIAKGLNQKLLQLRYIEALEKLAESPNSKIVVFGDGEVAMPSFSPQTQKPPKK
ncbi:MAG: hypothetical protein JXX14_00735 [Deltaproteobacteria bacterium]|nr:hypothetical protein [Deltaproteobacteria bacterium]